MEPDVRAGEDHCIVADVRLHRAVQQQAPHCRHRPVGWKHVPAGSNIKFEIQTAKKKVHQK